MQQQKPSIFQHDVRIEDVEDDPFERFGGEQLHRTNGSDGEDLRGDGGAFAGAGAASSPKSGADRGSNPIVIRRSIFVAPAAAPLDAGSPKRSNAGGGGDVRTAAVSGATPLTATRKVMMLNTDLSTGYGKTLRNTIGRKGVTVVAGINSGYEVGGGSLTSPRNLGMSSLENSNRSNSVLTQPLSSIHHPNGNPHKFGPLDPLAPRDNSASGAVSSGAAGAAASSRVIPRISTMKGIPKHTRGYFRFSRTLYMFCTIFCPILALALVAATTGSGYWLVRKDTLFSVRDWYEVTTFAGECECHTTLDFVCSTLNNAFSQVSQMSAILVGCEFLLVCLLVGELSYYGIFGGTQFNTRLVLIVQVMGFATAVLTLILYAFAYTSSYCGEASFQTKGFQLGWCVYLRGIEVAVFFVTIVLGAMADSGNGRGPPASQVFLVSLLLTSSFVSTVGYGWMNNGSYELYSITSYCQCWAPCSTRPDFPSLLSTSRDLSTVQTLVGVLTLLFILLRCVDNLGATLKFAEISGIAFMAVAGVNLGNLYRLDFNAACTVPGRENQYVPAYSMYAIVASAVLMLFFVILNGLYMTRFFVRTIEEYLLQHVPRGSPWHEWNENRLRLRRQVDALPEPLSHTMQFVKGVRSGNAPHGSHGQTSDSGHSGSTPPVDHLVGGGGEPDSEFYRSGPFSVCGPRSFYQAFWWDELMSASAIHAEELEDALDDDDTLAGKRRSMADAGIVSPMSADMTPQHGHPRSVSDDGRGNVDVDDVELRSPESDMVVQEL